MKEEFGLAILNNLGPGLIMGNAILDRIADCARAHKLDMVESLYRETKWDLAWELGEQVLNLANRYACDTFGTLYGGLMPCTVV